MTEAPKPSALASLIELGRVDVQIALLNAHKKSLEAERVKRKQALDAQAMKLGARAKLLDEKKLLNMREEKAIKVERDRINDRRRALSTLNNYKLQQAAEREIDFVSKQVGQREELLLQLMREIEILEKDMAEIDAVTKGLHEEGAAFERDAVETLQGIETKLQEYTAERTTHAQAVGAGTVLTTYNRIKDRFPSNPVVDVLNRDSCAGCHMKLGPQVVVQISRGDVVKCPGCSRFLKLPAE
jgi:predicted  nucleic acid-binding Zn-ribbon protein